MAYEMHTKSADGHSDTGAADIDIAAKIQLNQKKVSETQVQHGKAIDTIVAKQEKYDEWAKKNNSRVPFAETSECKLMEERIEKSLAKVSKLEEKAASYDAAIASLSIPGGGGAGSKSIDMELITKIARYSMLIKSNTPIESGSRLIPTDAEIREFMSADADIKKKSADGYVTQFDPRAGFLTMPTVMFNEVVNRNEHNDSSIRSLVSQATISTNTASWSTKTARATAEWSGATYHAEKELTGKADYGTMQISLNEWSAVWEIHRLLLADPAYDVAGEMAMEYRDAISVLQNQAFVNGNGVDRPEGLMTKPGVGDGVNEPSDALLKAGVAEYRTGQAATLSAAAFDPMFEVTGKIKDTYMSNARWIMKRGTMIKIYLWKDNNGMPIIARQSGSPFIPEFAGFPVSFNNYFNQVAADARIAFFGDPRRFYQILDNPLSNFTGVDNYTGMSKGMIKNYLSGFTGGKVKNNEAGCYVQVKAFA